MAVEHAATEAELLSSRSERQELALQNGVLEKVLAVREEVIRRLGSEVEEPAEGAVQQHQPQQAARGQQAAAALPQVPVLLPHLQRQQRQQEEEQEEEEEEQPLAPAPSGATASSMAATSSSGGRGSGSSGASGATSTSQRRPPQPEVSTAVQQQIGSGVATPSAGGHGRRCQTPGSCPNLRPDAQTIAQRPTLCRVAWLAPAKLSAQLLHVLPPGAR